MMRYLKFAWKVVGATLLGFVVFSLFLGIVMALAIGAMWIIYTSSTIIFGSVDLEKAVKFLYIAVLTYAAFHFGNDMVGGVLIEKKN